MTDEIQKVEAKLSLKLLLGLIGTALAIAGAVAGIMGAIYCTKSEMQETKTALKEDVHLVTLKAEKTAVQAEVRDWKINTVQVQRAAADSADAEHREAPDTIPSRARAQASHEVIAPTPQAGAGRW